MKINTFHLKVLALLLMIVDHLAHFLVPASLPVYWVMRAIGRIAAPLFWYCFVTGLTHTSNKTKYISRLGIFAAIMAVGNTVISSVFNITSVGFLSPNIFLTMFLTALVIVCMEQAPKSKSIFAITWYLLSAITLGMLVHFCAEYGSIALISILCLYFIRSKMLKYVLFVCANILLCFLTNNLIQIFMILSVPIMLLCGSEKPKYSMKWLFYLFYPAHLWVLMIVSFLC